MFYARNNGQPPFRTDAHTWLKCAGGKFWVGYMPDKPPKPEELIRQGVVSCSKYILPLGANLWSIPCSHAIPTFLSLDDNGRAMRRNIEGPEIAKIEAAGQLVQEHFDAAEAAEKSGSAEGLPVLSDQQMLDVFVDCMAYHYHLGKWEVAALQLATDTNILWVMMALVDAPVLAEIIDGAQARAQEKKKD
jgi:hypothetical protein